MDPSRRNLRNFKWRESEVLTLLKLYKQYECLWNFKIPEYRNKYMRDRAYTHMIKGLGVAEVTIADVRKKIKGLRTTYNDELNKISSSVKNGAEGADVYQPSVFWFGLADSFLREVAENRKEVIWSRAPPGEKEASRTETQSLSNVSLSDYQDPIDDDEVYKTEPPDNDCQYFEAPESSSRPRKRKASPIVNNGEVKSQDESAEQDEIDLFGRFVVMQLRKLPEMAGLKVMQDFHKILLDARMTSTSGTDKYPAISAVYSVTDINKKLTDKLPAISAVYSVTDINKKLTNMLTGIYRQDQKDPLNPA